MHHLEQLIEDYGKHIGIPGLALPADGALRLDFDEGLEVHIDHLDDKVVLYSQVGSVEEGAHEKLESLLSANLMWRDTDGATLSMDPYSRAAILAKSYSAQELDTVYRLTTALDQFCHLTQSWQKAMR